MLERPDFSPATLRIATRLRRSARPLGPAAELAARLAITRDG
jgi:hypothetical protein